MGYTVRPGSPVIRPSTPVIRPASGTVAPTSPTVRPSAASPASYPWDGNSNIVAFIADAAHITIGTGVSAWEDTSGTFSLLQTTPGKQPAWSATSFNGNPGVSFDGTDDELISTDSGLVSLSDGDDTSCMILLAMNLTSSASGSQFVGFYFSGAQQNRVIRAGGIYRADRLAVNAIFSSVSTGYQRLVSRFVSASTVQRFYIDEVEDASSPQTSDAAALTANQFGIFPGSFGAGTQPYPTGIVGGCAVITADDTTARDQFAAFMAARMP